MATNLDVDINAIETLMQLGTFRSKREAVDAAVAEAISYRKQLKALEFLGTIDFITQVAAAPAEEVE
jgi:Bacterial antitoxin of type II TA system, VapB